VLPSRPQHHHQLLPLLLALVLVLLALPAALPAAAGGRQRATLG
jgi:hypothetical protein